MIARQDRSFVIKCAVEPILWVDFQWLECLTIGLHTSPGLNDAFLGTPASGPLTEAFDADRWSAFPGAQSNRDAL